MESKNHKIVFLRHGESQWNLENRFTGWTDIDLTEKGEKEAQEAGILLNRGGFNFDLAYTSVLKRAKKTLKLCLNKMNIYNLPTLYKWRLNERHYGALQGLNKAETARQYGEKQVHLWRRSYDICPPELEQDDKRHPRYESKYIKIKKSELPSGECLKDTLNRVMPLWENDIVPKIFSGHEILLVAHGNSIRAIVKILEKLSNEEIIDINIPTGVPLVYELSNKLTPLNKYYLGDLNGVKKKLVNVISQGKSK